MGSDYLAWIIFAGIIVIIVLLIVQIIIFYRMSGNLGNTESEIKSAIDKIDPLVDSTDQIVNKIDPIIDTSGNIVNKISPVLDYGINYYCNLSKQAYPFCPGYFAPVPPALQKM